MSKKLYLSKSPEYVKHYYSRWYKKNRAKQLAYLCEKVTCDCGASVGRGNMSNHCKTKKHRLLMSEINKELKLQDYDRMKSEYSKIMELLNGVAEPSDEQEPEYETESEPENETEYETESETEYETESE
jgi:hypothetical protein